MKQRIDWAAGETLPDRRAVLRLQGIPDEVEPSPRIAAIVEEAMEAYRECAEPRALVADIPREAFAGVLRGDGRNAPVVPIETVVTRADTLALFVATVGAPVTERTRHLLAHDEPALAAMLDAVASAAADGLTARLADRFQACADGVGSGDRVALGYSPGYCGWHVSGQRALFDYLGADAIGVSLNDSCLMHPLKSVSGVLAAGHADIHRFAPAWAFCADCRNRTCLVRMNHLPSRGRATAPEPRESP